MASRKMGAAPDLAPTPSSGGVTDLNVTPLLDVLLVLLLIGMVSAGLSRRSLPVTLPAPAAAPVPLVPVLLELDGQGGYLINAQPIPAADLGTALAAIFADRPVRILFIKTHPDRTYQDFITAADLARGVGVTMVAAVTH